MAKYIARTCPKCGDYFGLLVNQPPKNNGEHRSDNADVIRFGPMVASWAGLATVQIQGTA